MLRVPAISVVAAVGLALTGCESNRHVRTAADETCWIRGADGRLQVLDHGIENLETCGARLEVRYIQGGKPVSGAYGGMDIFVSDRAIEAGSPYRFLLISHADRAKLSTAIRLLLEHEDRSARLSVQRGDAATS